MQEQFKEDSVLPILKYTQWDAHNAQVMTFNTKFSITTIKV